VLAPLFRETRIKEGFEKFQQIGQNYGALSLVCTKEKG
jgi:hypothetical protein